MSKAIESLKKHFSPQARMARKLRRLAWFALRHDFFVTHEILLEYAKEYEGGGK